MKFKILLLALSLFTFSTSLFANPLIDSIGVKNNDGKKMILFKVKAGDTYYSIGHRYNIKAEVLMKFNGSKKQTLSIGKIVEVPTDQPFKKSKSKSKEKEAVADKPAKETKKEKKARLAREEKEALAEKKHYKKEAAEEPAPREEQQVATTQPTVQQPVVQQPVVQQPTPTPPQDTTPPTQYKVSAGETLYSIAKRFNTNVDNITKLNNLTSTSLSPGQILLVKPATPQQPVQRQQIVSEAQQVVAKRDSNLGTAISKDSSALAERHLNANKFGIYEKNEKGVATWIDDPSLDPNKKLVLHRTAPIGTVIKITNPMTNRTTFAKVVGRFTDSESTKDCIIVMTKNVADSLGALDKRFHVNISYGSPNE
ncbi:MAG: LysM peptidoglycan-binding domain-containing protein [Bacteroidota bacterium]|nr:LysM peptidoglycan-binding domain-containing protein [Bacteroidota bacterium]